MRKILREKFFNRPTITVARELLGKYLVCRCHCLIRPSSRAKLTTGHGENKRIVKKYKDVAVMITEVEVYDGFKDKASQAFRGKTERNKIMFGEAGTIYVYFTYGMHFMLNIVTGKKNYPAAVLIRGAGEYNGPAKLTKALKIDKRLNNKTLGKKTGLWVEDRGILSRKLKVESGKWKIIRTPRIGIPRAEEWVKKPLRFVLKNK
ncbi:MAG: DNA-3-methyladenine glycosylase [Patescibacteria group bacterium]